MNHSYCEWTVFQLGLFQSICSVWISRGIWPHAQYQALFVILWVRCIYLFNAFLLTYHIWRMKIIGGLVLLITSFAKLDTKWCSILVHQVFLAMLPKIQDWPQVFGCWQTPFLNPNFVCYHYLYIFLWKPNFLCLVEAVWHFYHSFSSVRQSIDRLTTPGLPPQTQGPFAISWVSPVWSTCSRPFQQIRFWWGARWRQQCSRGSRARLFCWKSGWFKYWIWGTDAGFTHGTLFYSPLLVVIYRYICLFDFFLPPSSMSSCQFILQVRDQYI